MAINSAINSSIKGDELKKFLKPETFESDTNLQNMAPREEMQITVTLGQLRPYDYNPRESKNPKHHQIKESIKARGLDHPPKVTQRPSEDKFMVKSGGNTRLAILNELVTEIDQQIAEVSNSDKHDKQKIILELTEERARFYEIKCDFTPWDENKSEVESEIDLLAGHMSENDDRGDMIFIERAKAVVRFRKLFESIEERKLSGRELATMIKASGWSANQADITRYEYAVRELLDLIPNALWEGMGIGVVKEIRKYNKDVQILWEHAEVEDKNHDGWIPIWQTALRECNGEVFSINELADKLETRIAKALDHTPSSIQAELTRLMKTKNADPTDSILNHKPDSNVTKFTIPSASSKKSGVQHAGPNSNVDDSSKSAHGGSSKLIKKLDKMRGRKQDSYIDSDNSVQLQDQVNGESNDLLNRDEALELLIDIYEENCSIITGLISQFDLGNYVDISRYDELDDPQVRKWFEETCTGHIGHKGYLLHFYQVKLPTNVCTEAYIISTLFRQHADIQFNLNDSSFAEWLKRGFLFEDLDNEDLFYYLSQLLIQAPYITCIQHNDVFESVQRLDANNYRLFEIRKQLYPMGE